QFDCLWSRGQKLFARFPGEESETVAAAFQSNPGRRCEGGANLLGLRACHGTELKRCQAIAVQRHVCISRSRTQILPGHHHSLAMSRSAGPDKLDIRSEAEVAGDPLPDEVESIDTGPDVGPAARDPVPGSGGVVLDGAGLGRHTDIAVVVKDT